MRFSKEDMAISWLHVDIIGIGDPPDELAEFCDRQLNETIGVRKQVPITLPTRQKQGDPPKRWEYQQSLPRQQ